MVRVVGKEEALGAGVIYISHRLRVGENQNQTTSKIPLHAHNFVCTQTASNHDASHLEPEYTTGNPTYHLRPTVIDSDARIARKYIDSWLNF